MNGLQEITLSDVFGEFAELIKQKHELSSTPRGENGKTIGHGFSVESSTRKYTTVLDMISKSDVSLEDVAKMYLEIAPDKIEFVKQASQQLKARLPQKNINGFDPDTLEI